MIFNIESTEEDNLEKSLNAIHLQINNFETAPALTILFISSKLDLIFIERFLQKIKLPGEVIACTTSGELDSRGPHAHKIVGQVYFEDEFCAKIFTPPNLSKLTKEENILHFSNILQYVKEVEKGYFGSAKSFGIVLIDGLSVQEETFCSFLSNCLGNIPVVGGSAGDDLEFKKTFLLVNGAFQTNSALLAIVTTTRKFEVFKSQHFKPSDKKLVITDADPKRRMVKEINGRPAAEYYASILNIKVSDFSPMIFSRYPLMLKIGSEYFVRSVQQANPDGSLIFYCAIDVGLVLTLADKENILESNKRLFYKLKEKLGKIDHCLLFECILRKLEILDLQENEKNNVFKLYNKYNAIGFYTYGEQFSNIHINQTLTGVAFGKK